MYIEILWTEGTHFYEKANTGDYYRTLLAFILFLANASPTFEVAIHEQCACILGPFLGGWDIREFHTQRALCVHYPAQPAPPQDFWKAFLLMCTHDMKINNMYLSTHHKDITIYLLVYSYKRWMLIPPSSFFMKGCQTNLFGIQTNLFLLIPWCNFPLRSRLYLESM